MHPSSTMPLCLILTATITVQQDVVFTARRDTQTRLDDYKAAFRLWLAHPDIHQLVFVENSGFDVSEFVEMAARVPEKTVEFVCFTAPPFDGSLGKGYGEMLCLQQCLDESKLIAQATRFLKVSGRYFVANASELIQLIVSREDADVVCDMRLNLTWADSRALGGSVDFLRHYLCPMRGEVNDSTGSTFEHVLARAAHLAMAHRGLWTPPPFPIAVQGVSGSQGHVWQQIGVKKKLVNRLRQALFARTLRSGPP